MIECKHILLEPKWLGKGNQLLENILPDSPFSSLMSHTFNANWSLFLVNKFSFMLSLFSTPLVLKFPHVI